MTTLLTWVPCLLVIFSSCFWSLALFVNPNIAELRTNSSSHGTNSNSGPSPVWAFCNSTGEANQALFWIRPANKPSKLLSFPAKLITFGKSYYPSSMFEGFHFACGGVTDKICWLWYDYVVIGSNVRGCAILFSYLIITSFLSIRYYPPLCIKWASSISSIFLQSIVEYVSH